MTPLPSAPSPSVFPPELVMIKRAKFVVYLVERLEPDG
jgi:hypothetical protein